MAVATFDTLKFANTLKVAGVPEKQAEAQAVAFAEVIQVNLKDLVTKEDLTREIDGLRKDLRQEINECRKDLKQEIKDSERSLSSRIDTLEARIRGEMLLLKWMFGAMMTINLGVLIRLFVGRGPF